MTVANALFVSNSPMTSTEPSEPMGPRMLVRPLSPRESQIVQLLDLGRTPKEVAFELGIANATVRVLLARAVKKGGRAPRHR
jgi:DNA-binding NarL/FixJ family response regulator